MRKIVVLAFIVLSFTATQVQAEGFSLLAGFQTVSFGGDLSTYYDLPTGPGLVVNVGLPPVVGVPFDIYMGQRLTEEGYSGDDAKYNWIEVGPKIPLIQRGTRIRPEIFAGGGLYSFEIGHDKFDKAIGYYAGFGFEDRATEKISGRFQIKSVYWKTDTGSLDAPSLNFVLMYGIQF